MFRASPGNVAEIEHLLYGENDIIRHNSFVPVVGIISSMYP